MVGDEDEERVGIGILAVLFDGADFFFVGAAAEERFYAAHEEDLERGHERWRARAVEDLAKRSFAEIEFEDAEVARVRGDHVFQDGVATALAEESLVADEHIGGAEFARLQF